MAEPARPPPPANAPASPAGGAVPVVTPTGATGYLPQEFAADAGAQGARRALQGEMQALQSSENQLATDEALRKQFEGANILGGIEGRFAPQLAGAARGLSVGTSDEAILSAAELIGGIEGRELVRKRLQDYQSYAPIRSAGSELGAIAGASMLGDESALGAAPSAIGRLGAAAEGLVARSLGEGALARGAGVLARGAAEGSVFGAGTAVSEASLKNQELTGESLIGGAAHGALGGMVASGVFAGAGKALGALRGPAVTAQAVDSLAATTFGEAAPGVGKTIARAEAASPFRTAGTPFDVAAEGVTKLASRDAKQASELGEIWRNRDVAFNESAERVQGHERRVAEAINEQLANGRRVDMASFGDSKSNQMSKLVDQTRFDEQAVAAINWATDANKIVTTISRDATAGMGPSALRKWNEYMQKIANAIESGQGAKLHEVLDTTKRFVGREANFGHNVLNVAQKEFDGLYQGERGLKQLLESDVWGTKAATAQREINAATTQMLGEGRRFNSKFTTEFGAEAGRPLYTANTEAISGFMGRLTRAANDLDVKSAEAHIAARRSFLSSVERNYEFGPDVTKAIASERASLTKLKSTLDRATKEVSLINQVKRLQSEEQASKIGGVIGLITDTFSKPVTQLQRIAQLEGHTESVLAKVRGDTKKLVGASAPLPEGAPQFAPPKGNGQGFFAALLESPKPAIGEVGAAVEGKGRSAFEKRAARITELQSNPAMLVDRVATSLAPFETTAPKVMAIATATAMRGLDLLASKLPPSRLDPYSLQPQLQPKTRASDTEISRFMRYAAAIDDPLVVLREAKSGTLTRDQVDAVKTVYPKLYEEMRVEVMRSVVETKKALPYDRRIQLGILLDIPTDKSLSPDFQRAIQATYASDEQAGAGSPPPTLSRPIEIAGAYQTGTQQAVERAQ